MVSMVALPSFACGGESADARTVTIFLKPLASTVWIALPAYVGRRKTSALSTARMSEICGTSRSAATRGNVFFPFAVAGATMAS